MEDLVRRCTSSHLERAFMEVVNVDGREIFLSGNGPHILSVSLEKAPIFSTIPFNHVFKDIFVLNAYPETVRGVIDMLKDGYLVAFGSTYLALIQLAQVVQGGTVCRSQIVSTFRFVLGGRRTGVNTMELFFRNGSVEEIRLKQTPDGITGTRLPCKKFKLDPTTKLTFCYSKAKPLLLGTSNGDIIRASGIVAFKKKGDRVPVVQITSVGKNTLLVLFQNGTLELVDMGTKKCISSLEGRYTAMEQVFTATTIVVGDFVFGTTTGGLRYSLREALLPFAFDAAVFSNIDFRGIPFAMTSECFEFVKDDKLWSVPNIPGKITETTRNATQKFTAPKLRMLHFHSTEREYTCAYGGLKVYISVRDFQKQDRPCKSFSQDLKRAFSKEVKHITSVVLSQEHVFIQCDIDQIAVYKIDVNSKVLRRQFCFVHPKEGETSRMTAASILEYQSARIAEGYLCVIGFLDGSIGGYDGVRQNKVVQLKLVPIDIGNSYLCDAAASTNCFVLLSAKGLVVDVTAPRFLKNRQSKLLDRNYPLVVPTKEWNLKSVIGGNGKIVSLENEFGIAGFKQNTLSIYHLGLKQVIASVETAGHTRPFRIFNCYGLLVLTHTIPNSKKIIARTFKVHWPEFSTILYEVAHSASINCIRQLFHRNDDMPHILTGDNSGLVTISSLSPKSGVSTLNGEGVSIARRFCSRRNFYAPVSYNENSYFLQRWDSSGLEYTNDAISYTLFGVSTENELYRIGPYNDFEDAANANIQKLEGLDITRFNFENIGPYDVITAGDVNGWFYSMFVASPTGEYLHVFADKYHAHEIIEIKSLSMKVLSTEMHNFVVTMDVMGYIVIREYQLITGKPYMKLIKPPTTYQSAVPSVRCLEVTGSDGILVGGYGISSHDLNTTKS